jgi:hypothetical protein
LAAFLGALIAFVWSAIAHQNPLTMALGLSVLGPKEDAVLAALKSNVRRAGTLLFPWSSARVPSTSLNYLSSYSLICCSLTQPTWLFIMRIMRWSALLREWRDFDKNFRLALGECRSANISR